tara:strand:- start:5435 stop:6253 length:819 start_codon:yes stop_codon:yes gene_type:complete
MPVNHYFQAGNGIGETSEKRLHEDLIIEGLKIYGHDVYYLPRTLVNRDLVLGEDTSSRFDDSYMLEGYFESTEGFSGQQELINKFGLEIRDDITFTIAKRRWQDQVDSRHTMIVEGRPNEGDIIFVPFMNSFFEILFVEDQEPFYQLGNLPVYKLKLTRFEYSSEEINTGQEEIDKAEDKYSLDTLNYQFQLEFGTEAETGRGNLQLEDYHNDATNKPSFLINESFTAAVLQTQSTYAENLDLDTAAGFDTSSVSDDILDFTETNPFGEVNT